MKFQFQQSSSDCGQACIAMAAQIHGVDVEIADIKRRFYFPANGSNILHLVRSIEGVGLISKPVKVDYCGLEDIKLPAILHWGMNHYVVLHSIQKNEYVILDPASGRKNMLLDEVKNYFTGVAIVVEKGASTDSVEKIRSYTVLESVKSVHGWQLLMFKIVVLGILSGLSLFLLPIYLKLNFEFATFTLNGKAVGVIAISFILMSLSLLMLERSRKWLILRMTSAIDSNLSMSIARAAHRFSFDQYVRISKAAIIDSFGELRKFRVGLSEGVVQVIANAATLLFLSMFTFIYEWWLGLILVLFATLELLIKIYYFKRMSEVFRSLVRYESRERTILEENFEFYQTLRLNGMEAPRSLMWWRKYNQVSERAFDAERLEGQTELIVDIVKVLGRASVIVVSSLLVVSGNLSAESLYLLVIITVLYSANVSRISDDISKILFAKESLKRAGDILTLEEDILNGTVKSLSESPSDSMPVLAVNDVSFGHSEDGKYIFQNLNFTVDYNQTCCIVGKSVSGKSTLLRILAGLHAPRNGQISWFGYDLEQFDREYFSSQVGSVLQEDGVFSGTVAQNIASFDPIFDGSKLEAACMDADIVSVIEKLPMGIHTPIGNSSQMSTGEKHRLMLARALYKNPSVLLLDEITGNLDAESEHRIFSNLASRKLTLIITSHRAATIERADIVFDLDHTSAYRTYQSEDINLPTKA